MLSLLILLISINPFYEANFTSLAMRSISVFSNPGGLGILPGAECFVAYHPDEIVTGASLANLGIGMIKEDTITYYETGLGFRLPGAFSLGYAYQFDINDYDISNHIFGLLCSPNRYISIGYKTTIGEKNHMFGGMSIKPLQDYITVSVDLEYEGNDSIFTYYYGAMLRPIQGLAIYFRADEDFDWHAGIGISLEKIKLAGAYSKADKKFSGGIMLSAQSYETLLPKSGDNYGGSF